MADPPLALVALVSNFSSTILCQPHMSTMPLLCVAGPSLYLQNEHYFCLYFTGISKFPPFLTTEENWLCAAHDYLFKANSSILYTAPGH